MIRPTCKIIHKKKGRKIQSLKGGPDHVKVGFPAGKSDGGVIERAVYNNFGTSRGIPERPFMQNAMRAGRGKIKADMATAAKSILRGAALGQDVGALKNLALRKLGIKGQGLIQQEIISLQTPPNAPSTIRQKGSSNPLVDTGEMAGAVTWKIEE